MKRGNKRSKWSSRRWQPLCRSPLTLRLALFSRSRTAAVEIPRFILHRRRSEFLPDGVPGGFSVCLGCSTAEVLRTSRGYYFNAAVQNAYLSRRRSRGWSGAGRRKAHLFDCFLSTHISRARDCINPRPCYAQKCAPSGIYKLTNALIHAII